MLHANVLFATVEVKLNVALALLLGFAGPEVIVVSGAALSGANRKIVPLAVGSASSCRPVHVSVARQLQTGFGIATMVAVAGKRIDDGEIRTVGHDLKQRTPVKRTSGHCCAVKISVA